MKHCLVFASLISPSKMILFEKKYQTFDTVFHHQMKHLEVRQKYSAARRFFNSLLGVSSGDETLHLMFDILHQSASDKLAVVHSPCLFAAESFSSQRERKSVWQGFQSNIYELVSGKLSKCLYIHSFTHLVTSSALNECLFVHNFQDNCSTECHCITQKSIEV